MHGDFDADLVIVGSGVAGALMAAIGSSRGGERAIALASLVASAVLCAAMAFSGSLVAFLVVRFLAGVASAYTMVFLSSIVLGKAASAGRPGIQALHFAGVGIGIGVSGLITGAVFMAGLGWRESWLAAGIVSAALAQALASADPLVGDLLDLSLGPAIDVCGKAIAAALFGGAVVQPVVTHVALRTVDMWLNDALGDEAFEDEPKPPKARRRAKPKAE